MTSGIVELAIILITASILGIVARIFKQQIILAYIIVGILVGYTGFLDLTNESVFHVFSELGIMFLLFLIGLEINYSSLRLVGKPSLIVGLGQIAVTFVAGFAIAYLFHYPLLVSAYIAIILTFSSTVIVVKLLSEKEDLHSLYGKITIGTLLVQDLIAILLLIVLAGIDNGTFQITRLLITMALGVVLFSATIFLGRTVLPLVLNRIARSQELLFLTSLAWCVGIATLVQQAGFSIEIGGFLAGVALANSSEHFHIASRIKSLRDFFILIFFVILGSSLVTSSLTGILVPTIVFSLFVLIGNPLIVLLIMGFMGYRKRTSFLCGVTVAQISEFSLILAALGAKLGHLPPEVVSLITAVGLITITLSTYMIIYSEQLFRRLSPFLSLFERRTKNKEYVGDTEFKKPIVLIGCHRIGRNIAMNVPVHSLLVIDFDPDIVSAMRTLGYATLFGDAADQEIIERAHMRSAKLVISTSPDFEDNLRLLKDIRGGPRVILRAEQEDDARALYKEGADYVLLPHLTSGQYLGRSIAVDPDFKILEQFRAKDLQLLGSKEIE